MPLVTLPGNSGLFREGSGTPRPAITESARPGAAVVPQSIVLAPSATRELAAAPALRTLRVAPAFALLLAGLYGGLLLWNSLK